MLKAERHQVMCRGVLHRHLYSRLRPTLSPASALGPGWLPAGASAVHMAATMSKAPGSTNVSSQARRSRQRADAAPAPQGRRLPTVQTAGPVEAKAWHQGNRSAWERAPVTHGHLARSWTCKCTPARSLRSDALHRASSPVLLRACHACRRPRGVGRRPGSVGRRLRGGRRGAVLVLSDR